MPKKKEVLLSEKIAEALAPRRLLDPEIDPEDETAPKTVDFDLDEDNLNEVATLSSIRKQNIKLLHAVDAKYRGRLSSRKDDDDEDDDQEGDEDDGQEDDEDMDQLEQSEDDENGAGEKLDSLGKQDSSKNGTIFENSEDENDADSDGEEESGNEGETSDEDKIDDEEADYDDGDDYDDDDDEENDEEGTNEDESDFDADIGLVAKSGEEHSEESNGQSKLLKSKANDQQKKGGAVQNQLLIWEKLLEVRIHSQKLLIKANSLPTPTKFQELSDHSSEFANLAKKTEKNVTNLFNQMSEVQTLLLQQFSETEKFATSRKRKSTNGTIASDAANSSDNKKSRLADELYDSFSQFTTYRNSVISKWYDRTRVLTPGKKSQKTTDFDVVRKIEGVLSNKNDLIRKTQLLKGNYKLFDSKDGERVKEVIPERHNIGAGDIDEQANEPETERIYSTEVYDDTDFYHTQLRELIEYRTNASSNASDLAKQFVELQKLRKKMKKIVDTRASKGRKIRYVVHNKLLNFMAPNDSSSWTNDNKSELYGSLFGSGSQ